MADSLQRFQNSEAVNTLIMGHFLTCFSVFDAFTGDLLKAIYQKKEELFNHINRSMTIKEMLDYSSFEDIKLIILQNEIETFRRQSYVEQFETLQTRFSVQLKKFKNWPIFVECSQRRNLFTHCDGIVSEQYLTICKKENYKFAEDPKVGETLFLDPQYLFNSFALIIEVALKLGQTLWRKIFPEELKEADSHLHLVQYNFLQRKEWACACMAGEYAMELPKYSGEVVRNMMVVNYAIGLSFSGKEKEAVNILNKQDWSALCLDFRLAEAVLRGNFDKAYEIMLRIGKEGEYLDEHCYHVWPLFLKFRETEQFMAGYEAVYGYPFSNHLKKIIEESQADAGETIMLKEEELHDTIINISQKEQSECISEKP